MRDVCDDSQRHHALGSQQERVRWAPVNVTDEVLQPKLESRTLGLAASAPTPASVARSWSKRRLISGNRECRPWLATRSEHRR